MAIDEEPTDSTRRVQSSNQQLRDANGNRRARQPSAGLEPKPIRVSGAARSGSHPNQLGFFADGGTLRDLIEDCDDQISETEEELQRLNKRLERLQRRRENYNGLLRTWQEVESPSQDQEQG